MTNNGVDINKLLQVSTELPTSHFDGEFTKTAQFMMPSIDLTLRIPKLRTHLVNVFLDDENLEHNYHNPIFLLLSVKDYETGSWKDTTEILYANRNFKYEYYVGMDKGEHLWMFVFEVPEKYSHEYQCFLQGRYSKMSDEYKALFPKTIGATGTNVPVTESIIWGVLYKSNILKEKLKAKLGLDDATANSLDEYFDIPNPAREVFNYSIKEDDTKKE